MFHLPELQICVKHNVMVWMCNILTDPRVWTLNLQLVVPPLDYRTLQTWDLSDSHGVGFEDHRLAFFPSGYLHSDSKKCEHTLPQASNAMLSLLWYLFKPRDKSKDFLSYISFIRHSVTVKQRKVTNALAYLKLIDLPCHWLLLN